MLVEPLVLLVKCKGKGTHHVVGSLDANRVLHLLESKRLGERLYDNGASSGVEFELFNLEQILKKVLIEGISGMLTLDLPMDEVKENWLLHLHIMLLMKDTKHNHSKEENDDVDVVILFPAENEVQLLDGFAHLLSKEVLLIHVPHVLLPIQLELKLH